VTFFFDTFVWSPGRRLLVRKSLVFIPRGIPRYAYEAHKNGERERRIILRVLYCSQSKSHRNTVMALRRRR